MHAHPNVKQVTLGHALAFENRLHAREPRDLVVLVIGRRAVKTPGSTRWLRACLAALLVWGSVALPAHALDPDTAEYNQTIEQAVELFRVRDFVRARELFAEAHVLNPSARTLRGLGLTDFESGHYALAISELEQALRDSRKPLDAQQRSEVQAVIAHARGFVGTLDVQRTPADAKVMLDGKPLERASLALDVGTYTLRAEAPGYAAIEQQVEIQAGDLHTARLALVPLPADQQPPPLVEYDSTQLTAAWIVGGLGVAGVVVGSIFGVRSILKHNESDRYCDQSACTDMRGVTAMDKAIEAGDISTVAFVVGGVALGVGTVLLLTAPDSDDYLGETARAPQLRVGPGTIQVHGVF